MLRHAATGVVFVAANCHLYFDAKVDYIRHAQMVYLLERLALFIESASLKHGLKHKPAVILCGDFNSGPVSSVMSVLHDEPLELAPQPSDSAASALSEE
jgi:endonuclease/exonuclease/phosphatase family metal-dependent hydrolase